ncbi:hypothetical protein O0I10_009915 [Lichtheimia ornata]|uniref:Uncharacterized protein n=1 Tax=Lichtheimia ornata TaxID=688661 RepID=A0AAD7UVQ5_9FUNG|nr:uncharacterized protein O0I10_009915 [Lichtheimia ornata]KAJ8654474.1 hypothetical protein O0I10_009915 [Lichtheimia ornata]
MKFSAVLALAISAILATANGVPPPEKSLAPGQQCSDFHNKQDECDAYDECFYDDGDGACVYIQSASDHW